MLLLLLGFGIFFLNHDPDVFLSSSHIFFPLTAAFALWFLSGFYCVRGAVTLIKKKQCAGGFKNFLAVDNAVLFCMLTVFCIFAALIIDLFLFPDTGKTVVKGDQRITVYADPVPLSLEDLSIPAEGTYRSSRFTERNGLIMQSLYGSDQSFSSPDSTENLSMISYSVFRSAWRPGLDWVENRKGLAKLPEDEELAVKFNAGSVRTDGHHRLSVRYPDTLFVFYTSGEITGSDSDLVKERLSLP
ncbi:MAG: hypothetical protein IKP86_08720 [Anaerolineaceae bacterium]|nr:hypothetical protein [Anaerolineaceae bacterium]